ncbi:class I SAM-dependent methyltransferase [Bradyrhizobium sp. LjRoot220]|uniref:class I SAM-dependent methyltransferase n=1 Tax=Bradyrhizobium sp. LjRoot220 TaxID=3342284 RepID=UPI003ECDCE73
MNSTTVPANEIDHCEVCGSRTLVPVLDLGAHPMCDDLVAIGSSRACAEYPIDILYCENCRTAHQRFQVPKRELFPESYHYRSRFTADVLSGMKSLADACEQRFGLVAGKKVVDVGCNDGSLLDFFREKGATTIGVEPTSAAKDCAAKGHVTIHDFFTEATADQIVAAHGKPDFITFTNVFAHIEDLGGVIAALKRLIGEKTILVIENHYLGSVLLTNQFDTFYHEHPRTYSYRSFVFIARALGLNLIDVQFPARYGGNIRIFAGKQASVVEPSAMRDLEAKEARFGEEFATLRTGVTRWRDKKSEELKTLVQRDGPLRGKAFPGRAAILIKLLALDSDAISIVHEKPGSMKIGHYLPGTRIPIGSDDDLFKASRGANPLLNLAWHIPVEIRSYLKENGYDGPVIDILSQQDFQPGT